jgi:aspartyl-tRNA(Asn)/glutamyl-tRNA(Gln) amidotransferase subunit C
MTKLSRDEVFKLAVLAHIDLSEDEVVKFQKEFTEILSYVEQLQTVNIDKLEPTYQVTGLNNVTRKDEIIEYGISQEELLKNLPAREGKQIKVKRVL